MIKQPQPPGFENHIFQFAFRVETTPENVWDWLNDTKTFTETQIWPYKVEFYSPDPENVHTGFNEGILTNHTGPFINFAGELSRIEPNKYRDLQYFYGSYAFRFRLVRPYRLEFNTVDEGDSTIVTCTLSSYVKPWFDNIWTTLQTLFWGRFKRWASKSIMRNSQREVLESSLS